MTSNLLTILAALAVLCVILGFAAGRVSTATKTLPRLPLHLSDEAIAHIAYEARRAYQRSLGIIRLRTWNNLTDEQRASETKSITNIRENGTRNFTSTEWRLRSAIVDLSTGR